MSHMNIFSHSSWHKTVYKINSQIHLYGKWNLNTWWGSQKLYLSHKVSHLSGNSNYQCPQFDHLQTAGQAATFKCTRRNPSPSNKTDTYARILDGLVPSAPPMMEMLLIFTSVVNLQSAHQNHTYELAYTIEKLNCCCNEFYVGHKNFLRYENDKFRIIIIALQHSRKIQAKFPGFQNRLCTTVNCFVQCWDLQYHTAHLTF